MCQYLVGPIIAKFGKLSIHNSINFRTRLFIATMRIHEITPAGKREYFESMNLGGTE